MCIYIYIYIYIKAKASTRCCHVRQKVYLKKWHVISLNLKIRTLHCFNILRNLTFPLTAFESLFFVPICFARASSSDSNNVYFEIKKGLKIRLKKTSEIKRSSLFTLVFLIFSLSKKTLAELRLRERVGESKFQWSLHINLCKEGKKEEKNCAALEICLVDHRYFLLSFLGTFFSFSLSFSQWFFVVLIWFWNFSMISG